MGRPPKIDDIILLPDGKGGQTPRVRWEVIVDRVRAGSYAEVAAMSTGVSAATYYRWKADGEDRVVDGKIVRAKPRFREFREALDRASAEAEMSAIAHVQKAFDSDWRAAMTYLERRAPGRWRKRDSLWHGGPGEGDAPLTLELGGRIDLGPEAVSRLDAVLDILEDAGALERRRGDQGSDAELDSGEDAGGP